MITIIAEKPSVARQISRVVGATQRKVGYYGGNYRQTYDRTTDITGDIGQKKIRPIFGRTI